MSYEYDNDQQSQEILAPEANYESPDPVDSQMYQLMSEIQGSGSWFFWLAGLSIANLVLALIGSPVGFVFDLGITYELIVWAVDSGAGKGIVFGLPIAAALLIGVLGVWAKKACVWAFVVGIILYAADGLLLLRHLEYGVWIDIAAHCFVLFIMVKGLIASIKVKPYLAQARD